MNAPSYFRTIEQEALRHWTLLESEPAVAGPWHQLFRQVQSPRHVISELLQNANDAGAKSASVRLEGSTFVFEHDGHDFDADQFGSLCRFGYSNKRTLHTIGFRGVGFKSTFSLGDTVEVQSPTLSLCFKKNRFTHPVWMPSRPASNSTIIRVPISDKNRIQDLRKNFSEWAESPASLLFFNNLRELSINGQLIQRQPMGNGPVPESKWVKLVGAETHKLLLIRSPAEPFPEECAEEIRAERGVNAEEMQFPPCRVEIVLGMSDSNRLYVVLPTGASIEHPFSCNAPFIQDPARFAIKDPSTSPTNRWLLERIGALAGQSLLSWLRNSDLAEKERAKAYDLLHDSTTFASDLNGTCSQIIAEHMIAAIDEEKIVLSAGGKLVAVGEGASIPTELYEVWEPEKLSRLFAAADERILSSEIDSNGRKALDAHGWISTYDSDDILNKLEALDAVPKPSSWPQLHALWAFVESEIGYDHNSQRRRRLKIVPADGNKTLLPANAVVRLSSRRDVLSAADWKFVMDYAPTLDAEWATWISKRNSKGGGDDPGFELLEALSLHEPSPVDRIVAQASLRLFKAKEIQMADCVRIAQIMAAFGAAIPSGFKFVARDRHLYETPHGIVVDELGRLEDLIPSGWAQSHLLHQDYYAAFTSCSRDAWHAWVESPASGLATTVPIIAHEQRFYSRRDVIRFATDKGANSPKEFHYRSDNFKTVDHTFPFEVLAHWRKLAQGKPGMWAEVLETVLTAPAHHWKAKLHAELRHEGRDYYKTLDCGFAPAAWIVQLRSAPCIRDAHGNPHVPAELFLRNPNTEPLMGVEPFVRAELDSPTTAPLLKVLGVRDTPTGADKLLARLTALSSIQQPISHIAQIARLYEALDRIAVRCSRQELAPIIEAFAAKSIILTEAGDWMTSGEVSVFPDDDNQAPTVHSSLRSLGLWPRVNVPERPALEHAIEWLQSLEAGTRLDQAASRRVRAALQRDPIRIWNECGCWLSLDGTWEDVRSLRYRLTMQGLVKWSELFAPIKTATANFQMLSAEIAQQPPFNRLANLADSVEFRVTRVDEVARSSDAPDWFSALALGLKRIRFLNEEETSRIRVVAQRLRDTRRHYFFHLEVTPYIQNAPAGASFSPKTLWQSTDLYIANEPIVRIYREIADEIARPFSSQTISEAIAACVDRSPAFVAEFLQSHFELMPESDEVSNDAQAPVESVAIEPETQVVEGQPDSPIEEDPIEEDSEDANGEGESSVTRKPAQNTNQAAKPSLIELYARQRGFRWHGAEGRFLHSDGRSLVRSEAPFSWEERSPGGSSATRLWVSDQRLASGVEVAAELWTLLTREPSQTAIVVPDEELRVSTLSGHSLIKMKDSRLIALYPSRYRLTSV